MVLYRLAGLLMLILLLESCSSRSQPTFTPADDSNSPFGHWLLLNAKDVQDDLITGVLYVGEDPSDKGKGLPGAKTKNRYVLTFLEKNFGHGCTDFVGVGAVEFNHDKQQWFLISEEDIQQPPEKLPVERHDHQLFVFLTNGTKLVFEQSTPQDLHKKTMEACQRSYSGKPQKAF